MPTKPKDQTVYIHLPARDVKRWRPNTSTTPSNEQSVTVTYPAVTVAVEISGWDLQALAEKAQINRTKRARSGPCTARAYAPSPTHPNR